MVELFNNTKNKEMVFSLNAEGIDPANVEVRMILVNEGKNTSLLFMGEVANGKVRFELPPLVELSESQKGIIQLEVIADGEYFKPWQSEFKVKAKHSFIVEASTSQTVESNKPQVLADEVMSTQKASSKEKATVPAPVGKKFVTENKKKSFKGENESVYIEEDKHVPVSFEEFLNLRNKL